jgi:hypothetical protein
LCPSIEKEVVCTALATPGTPTASINAAAKAAIILFIVSLKLSV